MTALNTALASLSDAHPLIRLPVQDQALRMRLRCVRIERRKPTDPELGAALTREQQDPAVQVQRNSRSNRITYPVQCPAAHVVLPRPPELRVGVKRAVLAISMRFTYDSPNRALRQTSRT